MRHRSVFYSLGLLLLVAAAFAPTAWAQVLHPPGHPPEEEGTFTCRASALRVTSPLVNSEPIVANRDNDPCEDESASALTAMVPGLATASALNAETDAQDQGATSSASVADVTTTVGDTIITATVLESQGAVTCGPHGPRFSGSSSIARLTIDGEEVPISGEPNQSIDASPLVLVVVNEQEQTDDTFTVRALRVTSEALDTEVVVAESIVDFRGNPC